LWHDRLDATGTCSRDPERTTDIIMKKDPLFLKTASYRVLIDDDGVGHIRITKRVNFRTILQLFREVYLELRKRSDTRPRVVIYLSPSLSDEMSDNLKDFLDFAVSCMDGTFELAIVE
jgi:hypothetical protein